MAGTASGSTGNALLTPSAAGGGQAGSVAKVFEILTRGESGLAQQFEQVMKQEVRRPAAGSGLLQFVVALHCIGREGGEPGCLFCAGTLWAA